MSPKDELHLAELIERKLNGTISEADARELESALLEDGEARRLYLDLSYQHAHLELLGESLVQEELLGIHSPPGRPLPWIVGVAAALVLGFFAWTLLGPPGAVATLISSEHASWESSLPTTPGSRLVPGWLKLKSGIATIRFRSGAEMVLEAPAHLVLETAMKAQLLRGSAVIKVPEPAIGFTIATPEGVAIDLGTEFAVSVDQAGRTSAFEVLRGEISVQHSASEKTFLLSEKEIAIAGSSGLARESAGEEKGRLPGRDRSLRIETGGREVSVIRNNQREERLHPDFLMAKRSVRREGYDRRSLFGFDLTSVSLDAVESARIRLNLVPCGLGFAARLPERSRFSIYGIPGVPPLLLERGDLRWSDTPGPEEGEWLGSFEISRGQQTGSFGIETEALARFLQSQQDGAAMFLLVRDTDESEGNGLVHAFAGSRNPEAPGPRLEIKLKNRTSAAVSD
jgi:hypothetical protein